MKLHNAMVRKIMRVIAFSVHLRLDTAIVNNEQR